MRFKIALLIAIICVSFVHSQSLLIQENFQNWTPQIASKLFATNTKTIYNAVTMGTFIMGSTLIEPNTTWQSNGFNNDYKILSNGRVALCGHGSFLQLPELESIGRVSLTATGSENLNSLIIQVMNGKKWINIPKSKRIVDKLVAKKITFDFSYVSPTSIRIISSENSKIYLWDLEVYSFSNTLPKIATPTIETISSITTNSIKLCWTRIANAKSYEVKVYDENDNLFCVIDAGNNKKNSKQNQTVINNLFPGLNYYVKVIAKSKRSAFTDSEPSKKSAIFTLLDIKTTGPKIILKLDDISIEKNKCSSSYVMDYLIQKNIKASFGVVANLIDSTAKNTMANYLDKTDNYGNKLFEIWNHGLDHKKHNDNLPEFSGTGYDYQKQHFEQATNIVNKNLGIQMTSLGTPWNASDMNTVKVMSENPNYKVFMCESGQLRPNKSSGILSLYQFVYIENEGGKPNFDYFLMRYNENVDKFKDYMVVQAHPNSWKKNNIDTFNKIIDFLISQGCEFVLPYEYYQSLALNKPSKLGFNILENNSVRLTWTDNSTNEEEFVVEKSNNNTDWINIAKLSANSTSYIDSKTLKSDSCYYRVASYNRIRSDYSNVIRVSFDSLSIVDNLNTNSQQPFEIFPNPCTTFLTIKSNLAIKETVNCSIYDSSGNPIQSDFNGQFLSGNYKFSFDIDFKPGIYFCRFRTINGSSIQKFIVLEH